jgi:hypothetical protein
MMICSQHVNIQTLLTVEGPQQIVQEECERVEHWHLLHLHRLILLEVLSSRDPEWV